MDKLDFETTSCWEAYASDEHQAAMRELADRYVDFLSRCKTERETVDYVVSRLRAAGYTENFAHDKVYNRLSALSKRVELASASINQEVTHGLNAVAKDIRGTVAELQEILGDSRRASAKLVGSDVLVTQLADICRAQGDRWGMDVSFEAPERLPELDPKAGWDAQCIVEEALTNAAKHGKAKHAVVRVDVDDKHLTISITDDGTGMDPIPDIETLGDEHKGLRGMHERARRLGGRLATTSCAGETTISLEIPHSPST